MVREREGGCVSKGATAPSQGGGRCCWKPYLLKAHTSPSLLRPEPAAKIILTMKSAHNMRDKAWLGKSDPYW